MKTWRYLRPDALQVLEDENVKRSLGRYIGIVKDQKTAKFLIAKKLPANFDKHASTEELWQQHRDLTKEFHRIQAELDNGQQDFLKTPTPDKTYFDLKEEIAERILSNCHFCMRGCKVNRQLDQLGYCKCGSKITVSSIFEHMGEEPELVPSGTVFTMGCTMRCKHCQNWTISQWEEKGQITEPNELAKEVTLLRRSGCRNINLVGGEPTPWFQQWLSVFKHVSMNVPIVWNSNSYYSPETAEILTGFADVYLLDFKYGPGKCAERISDAPYYWETCTRNHLKAEQCGELIIRVLVLPNHLTCCTKPTVEWIARNLGADTRVNIMFQYRPEWRANEIPELRRRLTAAEMDEAIRISEKAGLSNFIT